MNNNEIDALISLLEDPDVSVYNAVKARLLSLGDIALPQLKTANKISKDSRFVENSSDIISEVEFNYSFEEFKKWLKSDCPNLFDGAFWVNKYLYPEIEYEKILASIDEIKQDAWLQMNDNLTPLEQVKVLNHIIYNVHKFGRNSGSFYEPDNVCISKILETKRAVPVSMAVLYLTIARRLGLPVYGVNLPQNFIVAYIEGANKTSSAKELGKSVVSFYVNPYQNGAILTAREIEIFLKQQKIVAIPQFFNPCEDKVAIQRLLLHLFISFRKKKDFERHHRSIQKFINEFKHRLPDYNM